MRQHSESKQPRLHIRTLARASARADALANALLQARKRVQKRALVRALALAQALAQALALARVRGQTQTQTQTLAQARVRAQAQAQALAQALGQTVAMVQVQALPHAKAHMVTYREVLADSELMDIIYSIKPHYRHSLALDLWRHSQYWWLIQIIVPITRLPQELLHEILLIIIDDASNSPLVLMRVSKDWYNIVTGIWASFKLGTTTPIDAVTRKLGRVLDVVVDTESDHGGFTPSESAYQSIFAAIETTPRWRSLVVESLPAQADLPEHLINSSLQQSSDAEMSRLRTFNIKCPCEMSPLLERLLRILGTTASGELTTVEINSPSVISFLAPNYPTIFQSIKVLSLDTPRMPDPVDLLPHLHQLEALTASHLSLPIYQDDVNLPFVHTLRHLSLRAISIQWMSGRTFHALESCTLLFPFHQPVLHTFNVTLPKCNDLTFQGYPLDILSGISAQNLTHLTVKCFCFQKSQGSPQLDLFSSHALQETRLAPRILHISIEATNEAWIKAFAFMSNLEELVIDNAQPSSLGVKVLKALAHKYHATNLGTIAPLCPSLKRFGLRYCRWWRSTEHFDLAPGLVSIISSRQRSEVPLQSLLIWKESGQQEPLELIEGSWISLKAFERLTNVSVITSKDLVH